MQKKEKYTYTPVIKNNNACPIWMCFPSTYSIGMSALGYLTLFRILDKNENVSPELIFTDTEETNFSVKEVKLACFSFSFELDFLGVFKILEKYDLAFRSCDRDENAPLIFGGGPVLTANPEPYADFFDFILIGEGEEIIPEIIAKLDEIKNHKTKQEKLIELAKIDSVYVPSLYTVEYNENDTIKAFTPKLKIIPQKINKRYIKKLNNCVYSPILTENTMFANSFLIEIGRGCPKKCRFCLASYLTMPARYPDYKSITKAIDLGLNYTNKIGLLGALITEHPDFDKICDYIKEKRKEQEVIISVSSLRADNISELMVKTLVEGGQKSSTIAIEAGSEKLRKFINKQLSNENIRQSVKTIHENGLSALKIYGMLGLPSETQEDINELVDLLKILQQDNKGLKLTLSISSFVPKAHTPFQWEKREETKILQERTDYLQKHLSKIGVQFKPTSIKWDNVQAVLSRGDRRISYIIEKVYKYKGSLGSWGRSWKEALQEDNLSIPQSEWYSHRQIPLDETLPWDFINTGISKENLIKDRAKSEPKIV